MLVRNQTKTRIAALVLTFLVLTPLGPTAVASVAHVTSSAVASTTTSDEAEFFTLLNSSRAQAGLPALQHDAPLADTSRSWSATMGSKDTLYHDPNLAAAITRVEPNWRSAAENVGVGYGVQ
jgi:uncharacterized protein YkwD